MNSVTNFLLTIAGVVMLVFVFYDVYSTILRAAKNLRPFSELLNRGLWRVAIRLTQNLSRRLSHRVLYDSFCPQTFSQPHRIFARGDARFAGTT